MMLFLIICLILAIYTIYLMLSGADTEGWFDFNDDFFND